jgi:signal transduction histidine kinase/CheY-like chemotaxis protein
MRRPPLIATEQDRLRALLTHQILDTPPEPAFDAIVACAAAATGAPVSLISLVDETRQWFKARRGLDATETPREWAFCAHAIAGSGPLVVPDADSDVRFQGNPLVEGAPFVKSYLGAPLIDADGHALGTLCAIDHKPRAWTPTEIDEIARLANLVTEVMRLRAKSLASERLSLEIMTLNERLLAERSLFDAVEKLGGIGGWELDLETMLPVWSAQTCHIHEVSTDYQPTLETAIDFYAPEARPVIADAVARATANGEHFDLEIEIITANGNRRWVRTMGKPIFKNGAPVKLVGAFQDITERRAAMDARMFDERLQRAKAEIQERFLAGEARLAFTVALDHLCALTDSEYGFIGEIVLENAAPVLRTHAITDISWDAATRQLYQEHSQTGFEFRNLKTLFGAAMVEAKPVFANSPAHDPRSGGLPHGHPPMTSFLGAPIIVAGEMVAMAGIANRPGGYDEHILQRLAPLLEVIGTLVSLMRERQRREASESALKAAKSAAEDLSAKLRLAVQAGSIGLWQYLPSSGVLAWDDAMFSLYGRDPATFKGVVEDWVDSIHPDDRESAVADLNASLAEDIPFRSLFRIVRNDGSVRHISAHAMFSSIGSESVMVGANTDVTDFVAAVERAEAAVEAKSRFLANMSHEIRTPLNGVIGIAGVLVQTELTDRQREMAKLIQSSGETLQAVLNDILDMAKIEAGKIEMSAVPICVASEIEVAASLMVVRADEKGIGFSVDIAEEARGDFWADPVRLRQIIANLASNAVKFTSVGGVRIEVRRAADGAFVIRVCDTGIGFDDEARKRLFGRFEQADSSITRTHGGSGLGLSIVRALVDIMGGSIEVESAPGVGSTFTVTLPLEPCDSQADVSEAAAPALNPEAPRELDLRVLVAEDNPTNRLVIGLILETIGAKVAFVENGELAVSAVQSERFDVVLMDMQMPVMDGLTATRSIRDWEARQGQVRTPIIMLTANAMDDHRRLAIAAGCDLHVAKPISPADLYAALADAVRSDADDCSASHREAG